MINYESLIQACVTLELDPTFIGGNYRTINSYPLGTYEKPFDLKEIGFPEEEMEQVLEIGKIIYNLRSQLNPIHSYNLGTEKGKSDYKKDHNIGSILPALEESIIFWLKSGFKKSKEPKDLVIHNGRIFEFNPEYSKIMEKMDEDLKVFHRENIKKSADSARGAENVILR